MERRDFLKMAGMTGLMLSFGGKAGHSHDAYAGPFWVAFNAVGGWDPTSLFDPKGKPINAYDTTEIKSSGPFRYAPYMGPARSVKDPVTGVDDEEPFFDRFFKKYAEDLLVVRGIDMSTNSHETGQAYTWGGKLGLRWPSIPALVAAANRPDLAMSFISSGGYNETGGLVAATMTRNAAAFVNNLNLVAEPNRVGKNDAGAFQEPGLWNNILRPAMNQRLKDLGSQGHSLAITRRASILHAVRSSPASLNSLTSFLPAKGLTQSSNPLFAQVDLATAAFKTGVAIGADLSLDGFDTHKEHDTYHFPKLDDLLRGIDYLMHRCQELGIMDQLTLIVGSEFGRSPLYENDTKGYNEEAGKDHDSTTGAMFMGRGIAGGRVVGATDEKYAPMKVNPTTLALDPQDGIILRPEHLHRELREMAGLIDHPILTPYIIDAPLLRILRGR